MAKKSRSSAVKKVGMAPKKRAIAAKPKAHTATTIEKVCEDALKKLKSLNIELTLQADIEWCLGSYRHDKNPAGLYAMAEKALNALTAHRTQNTNAVTATFLNDLAKALKSK